MNQPIDLQKPKLVFLSWQTILFLTRAIMDHSGMQVQEQLNAKQHMASTCWQRLPQAPALPRSHLQQQMEIPNILATALADAPPPSEAGPSNWQPMRVVPDAPSEKRSQDLQD